MKIAFTITAVFVTDILTSSEKDQIARDVKKEMELSLIRWIPDMDRAHLHVTVTGSQPIQGRQLPLRPQD